jgi:hypothetical protein
MVIKTNVASNVLAGRIVEFSWTPGFACTTNLALAKYIQEDNITATKPMMGKYR